MSLRIDVLITQGKFPEARFACVIPAKAGIHLQTGFRIKSGMTKDTT